MLLTAPPMPTAPPRACSQPGCPELVRGRPRCPAHTREAEQTRGSSHARGYDARWREARLAFLRVHPLCLQCAPRPVAATVVDHVIAHKGDPGLFWDQTNWQSLCKPCHDARVDEGDFGRNLAPKVIA